MDGNEYNNMQIVRRDTGVEKPEAKKSADCPDINAFAGYLDNMLADPEKEKVEGHMAQCVPCRTNFYEVKMLMDTPPRATPEGLAENVKNNLDAVEGAAGGTGIKV